MMTDTQGDPPSAQEDAVQAALNLQREAQLRQQAVERMRYMSVQHGMHGWEHRYSDPIAPYGLAFLYAHQTPQGWLSLTAATKLWLAGPESADLPRLLFDLNELVGQQSADPNYDLRRHLANRCDEKMAEDAWYVGLGVSSLDTYSGTWDQACASVDRFADLPATVRIVLRDSTTIVCDRRGLLEFNRLTVHSTHALSVSVMDSPYAWSAVSAQDLRTDNAHAPVLRWMDELNLSLLRADTARLVNRQAPGNRRRRP